MTESVYNAFNHPFWNFSLEFYRQARVRELCLWLQDEFGFDVNLLLFACWLGRESRRLHPQGEEWEWIRWWQRNMVEPLRELRRVEPREGGLRPLLAETELKAEQCEQWWLFLARERLSEPAQETALQLAWDNLLEIAMDREQTGTLLFQQLRELAELSQAAPDGQLGAADPDEADAEPAEGAVEPEEDAPPPGGTPAERGKA